MIKFIKPKNLNGAELADELIAVGVEIKDKLKTCYIDGNGDFWLDIDKSDESKAKPIVAAHNGTTVSKEPTIEEKLESVGLNLNDLKAALGI